MAKKLNTTYVFEIMENDGTHITPKYKTYLKNYMNESPKYKQMLDEGKYTELARIMTKVLEWRYDLDFF